MSMLQSPAQTQSYGFIPKWFLPITTGYRFANSGKFRPPCWNTEKRSKMPGEIILPQAISVDFDDSLMWVELDDGRKLGVPINWYPRLAKGSLAERRDFFISPAGLHWEALDEDISIEGMLAGRLGFAQRASAA